jgi:hypothetical protein
MRKCPAFLAACLSLLASAAVAQPELEASRLTDFAQRMFATKSLEQKTSACFVRTYDAAHLARHRKQTVTAMKMLVSAERLQEDGQLSYSYDLGVNFRDRTGEFAAAFECGHARTAETKRGSVDVKCHDGCEGGDGVVIALAPDGKSILVKIDSVWLRPAGQRADDNATYSEFTGGADDHVLRLERVDMEKCKSLIEHGEADAAQHPE